MASAILKELDVKTLFDMRGVVAVVTGGSSGIGLMISSALIANGATVYVISLLQSELDDICQKYNDAAVQAGATGKMIGIQGDVRHKSEARRLAEEIDKREGRVTVLFNNAGIMEGFFEPPTAPTAASYVANFFDAIKQEHFDNTLQVNAVGPYWLSFAFLPLLEKWKNSDEPAAKKFSPQIIMTSSINGWTKDSNTGRAYPYIFSKSAIGHFTSSLAHELLPLGIRVNGIAPGLFPSRMSAPGLVDPDTGASLLSPEISFPIEIPANPTGGTFRDMGTLALFLVANCYVSGETVLIDGGTLLKHPSSY